MGKMKRMLFRLIVVLTFVSALLYECLTPLLSDDLSYMAEAAQAGSIADVFHQEVVQYTGWTGRSVAHIILRLFFYFFSSRSLVFNVTAALVFTALTLLMLALIHRDGRSPDSWRLYLLLVLGFWLFAVKPGQTVFWMTGACNYLFTTTIILGFFAMCASFFGRTDHRLLRMGLLFVTGIFAGWCNENTSGAAVLYVLLFLLPSLTVRRGGQAGTAEPAMAGKPAAQAGTGDTGIPGAMPGGALSLKLAALLGVCGGFAMQLLSPGNRFRAAQIEESHTGLMRYGARLLQILAELRTLFLPLLLAALFLLLLARKQKTSWGHPGMRNALLYLLLWAAASFALLLAPNPQSRTFFGAGVFLLIACAQLFSLIRWEGALPEAVRDFVVAALLLLFVFRYFEEGGNLARISREEGRRYALLEAAQAAEVEDAYIPILPEGFDSPYSMAYETDIRKEWYMFPNMQLGKYYRIDTVSGIPFDEYSEEDAP